MTALKDRVLTGLRWQAAAKLGGQLISWAITIFVMRLLVPADYGLMAMTMVLVGLSALVAEMGLGAALVRSPEATNDLQRNVFGLALMVNVTLYLLLLLLAPISVAVFEEQRLWALTAAMGLQLPLAALCVVPESMARRELGFKALSLIELVQQIATALTTLTFALAGFGVWSLVIGHIVASLLKAAMLLWHFGTVAPRFELKGQRELLVFGGSLTANRVIWYFTSQADIFVAGKVLGLQALGFYTVALQIATMPMQKLMAISNQVAFSAYAKLQSDANQLNTALRQSLTLMSAITFGLLWGLAGTAPNLIPLLLGTQWIPVVVPLQIIALVVPLRIVCSMLSTALIATGHVNTDLKNNLTTASVLIPAFILGAYFGEVIGLAIAWAIGYLISAAFLIWRTTTRIQVTIREIMRSQIAPFFSGITMLVTLNIWHSFHIIPNAIANITAEIFLGLITYIIVIAITDRSILYQVLDFLGRRRSRL